MLTALQTTGKYNERMKKALVVIALVVLFLLAGGVRADQYDDITNELNGLKKHSTT